jgi:hypothetical protein
VSRTRSLCLSLLALASAALFVPAASAADSLLFPFELPAGAPPQLGSLLRDRMPSIQTRRSMHPKLALKADGYDIGVIGAEEAVALVVSRDHASTAYVAKGTASGGRIDASFGKLGRVAVRFQPAPTRSRANPRRGCRGANRRLVRRGVFVGTIRFRGEDGYVSIDAKRAEGVVEGIAPRCAHHSASPPPRGPAQQAEGLAGDPLEELEASFVGASWRENVSSASVAGIGIFGSVLFFATTGESTGQLAKLRFASATSGERGLSFNDALTHARIAPPAPFAGTGVYKAAPDGKKTWSGSLAASFPDTRLPLVGPQFNPELEAGF